MKNLLEQLKSIKQTEIIKRTNIAQSKISLVLNGKRKMTAEELLIIGKEFDLDLNSFKEQWTKQTRKEK